MGPTCAGFSFTNTIDFSGYTLADYGINPANVTAVYSFAISSFSGAQTAGVCPFSSPVYSYALNQTSTSSGIGYLQPFAAGVPYPMQQVLFLRELREQGLQPQHLKQQLTHSGETQVLSTLVVNSIGLIVYYTGTPVTSPSYLNIAAPLTYNKSTNTLGVDLSYPQTIHTYPLSTQPSPTVTTAVFISGTTDCVNASGNPLDEALCVPSLSGSTYSWVPLAGGGGGGDTITSPGSTLTVGGTPTNTTLDLNLGHANTWTVAQTFSSILDTGSAASTGNFWCLQIDDTGLISNTGTVCGAGGGGGTRADHMA